MRNSNEYAFSDGFGSGGSNGAPIIAPVFATTPGAGTYAAPAYGGGFGFGGDGALGAILVGSLLGGRGLGHHGGCDNGNDHLATSIYGATVLGKLGSIEGAIPLASLQTQNAILEQTGALSNQMNQSNLAQLAATAGVKDAVQNGTTAVLLNASQNTQAVLGAICNLSSKIDQNRISELETELAESRSFGRTRDLEVNISQNVNQQQAQLQAQAQQQAQFSALFGSLNALIGDIQAVKQGQVIFNSGTMAASGTQAAANTKVA